MAFEEEVMEEAKETAEIEEDRMKTSKGCFCATTAENQVIKKLIVGKKRRMRITKKALQRKMMMNVSCSWPFLVKKRLLTMFGFCTVDVPIICLEQNHCSKISMTQKKIRREAWR